MIERLTDFPDNVVAIVCDGRVTRRDYEDVLIPLIEATLNRHEKVRLYYQTGYDFMGIEPGVSHEFNVGMDHLLRWDRIAIVTDIDWIRETIRALSFLLPGAVEIFPVDEARAARAWILAPVAT
jgi:SpoIIAA-like